VAETSITIPDVVFVVNSGREKHKSHDAATGAGLLEEGYTSRASEQQRRGRAGRVRPGHCFHLYPRWRSRALLVRGDLCDGSAVPVLLVASVKGLRNPVRPTPAHSSLYKRNA
jgi:hypothetical protein